MERKVNGIVSERVDAQGHRFVLERHEVSWRKGVDKPILLGAIEVEVPAEITDYCAVGDSKYSALALIGFKALKARMITNAQDDARLKLGAEKGLVEAKPENAERQMVKGILAKAKAKGISQDKLEKLLATILA